MREEIPEAIIREAKELMKGKPKNLDSIKEAVRILVERGRIT